MRIFEKCFRALTLPDAIRLQIPASFLVPLVSLVFSIWDEIWLPLCFHFGIVVHTFYMIFFQHRFCIDVGLICCDFLHPQNHALYYKHNGTVHFLPFSKTYHLCINTGIIEHSNYKHADRTTPKATNMENEQFLIITGFQGEV